MWGTKSVKFGNHQQRKSTGPNATDRSPADLQIPQMAGFTESAMGTEPIGILAARTIWEVATTGSSPQQPWKLCRKPE